MNRTLVAKKVAGVVETKTWRRVTDTSMNLFSKTETGIVFIRIYCKTADVHRHCVLDFRCVSNVSNEIFKSKNRQKITYDVAI